MDFPNPAAYTMLCDMDTLSVHSSCHCIKLIPCLSHPLQKKICTKALLPDLCSRVILKIMVVMVFCDLENASRIYFYDYFVQRKTLKLQLWGLCLIWLLVLWCFISFQLQFHLFLHVFLFLPCLFHFSSLLLSVSFPFSFKTSEILPCCKLKFTSATKNFCFLK